MLGGHVTYHELKHEAEGLGPLGFDSAYKGPYDTLCGPGIA